MGKKIFGEMQTEELNELAVERIRKGLLLPVATAPIEKTPEHTIEDVRKKLEAELGIYRDGDSKYVVEKLIERCEKDKDLLNAIMLPHKSYDKAFQYFFECSRTVGYKMPHGNMVYLDNDKAVNLSVEYFKKDDKAEKKQKVGKKAVPKKEKPKAELVTKKQEEAKKSKAPVPATKPESKTNKREIDGQMSLFDF